MSNVQKAAEFIARTYRNSPQGAAVIKLDLSCGYINGTTARMFGLSDSEYVYAARTAYDTLTYGK